MASRHLFYEVYLSSFRCSLLTCSCPTLHTAVHDSTQIARVLGQLSADQAAARHIQRIAYRGMLQPGVHEPRGAHRGVHEAETLQGLQAGQVRLRW